MIPIRASLVRLTAVSCLLPSGVAAQTLRGLLLDRETERPIDLGRVTLITEERDSVASTLTDEDGFFTLTARDPGTYRLVGSALGYRGSVVGPYDLEQGALQIIEVRLGPRPVPVQGVVVSASRLAEPEVASLVATGFYDRLLEGRGEFITPGEIARSSERWTPQLFRALTLVRLLPALGDRAGGPWNDRVLIEPLAGIDVGLGMTPEERRARKEAVEASPSNLEGRVCEPRLFVDGRPLQLLPTESLSDGVPKAGLEAVEVYRAPFGAPSRYQGTSMCGVILFWTRRR